jgi:CspA family cold shock protein
MQGTIKKVIADKGYGFIKPNDGGDDLFFHHSAVEGTTIEALSEGQAVTFDEGRGPKGPRAENVQIN